MKKIIVCTLNVLLSMGLCSTMISAKDTSVTPGTDPKSGETTLTTSFDADYVVVIPESAELKDGMKITSSKMNTEPNKKVNVRISSGLTDGNATLKRMNVKPSETYFISVAVKLNGNPVTKDTIIATFQDQSTEALDSANGVLSFGEAVGSDGADEIKAGNYQGSLIFMISYE